MNRRVATSKLVPTVYEGSTAYWGESIRYREGRKIYSIPFGIVWWGGR